MKKNVFVAIAMLFTLLCSGCWDMREIEQRGYIIGLALDTYQDLQDTLTPVQKMRPQSGKKKYVMTAQIPIWKLGQPIAGGAGGGGVGKQKATWNLSVEGNSLMEMNRELATRSAYPPFYDDMVAVVISQDLARQNIVPFLDFMLRDIEFRPAVRLFVAEKKARDILSVIPQIDSYSSQYLWGISQNNYKTGRMLFNVTLGDISEYLYADQDFALPLVRNARNEIKNAGAVVIRKNKMVGQLNELETAALNMVNNNFKGGVVTFTCPDHPEEIITYEVRQAKTLIYPEIKKGRFHFRLETYLQGNVAEIESARFRDAGSQAFLEKVSAEVSKTTETNIRHTLTRLQKYKADAAQLITQVKQKKYKAWKKTKSEWRDKYFPLATFDIQVKAQVQYIGTTK
ncbi:Ger(x)C family germination protein [Thermincola ferriacetica]|uniref:Ger(X)C family germination protein n=1 Tax=Thermincola ferriacetica TaxID=281456 RepID=A0A0L6W1U2_9FIRM|nr:Ger(x)C family spore germination protein [Thermincola ferriacetica]KNZ69547.1 Ger(x)C family germination protein [Thermincola ferriacetica]